MSLALPYQEHSAHLRQGLCIHLGIGSRLHHQGTAGFSAWFHFPGFHFGRLFLTHSHFLAMICRFSQSNRRRICRFRRCQILRALDLFALGGEDGADWTGTVCTSELNPPLHGTPKVCCWSFVSFAWPPLFGTGFFGG